jgi:hypothetical protein
VRLFRRGGRPQVAPTKRGAVTGVTGGIEGWLVSPPPRLTGRGSGGRGHCSGGTNQLGAPISTLPQVSQARTGSRLRCVRMLPAVRIPPSWQ